MLAAGALVASLFAVGASPAAAIDDKSKPDHEASASACVGPARNDYGFTDLGTLEAAVPNINCLAYYGISAGRTADTFDPNANVRRSEMALFLHKAASLAGIDLSKGDMSADFGDIAELGDNRQAAIKALARNGIMEGRGDMAFEPNADINRAEMAMALVSLVDHASDTVTVAKSGANKGLYVLGSAPGALPNDNFTDVVRTKPRHVNNAVSAAYELGITSGKSLDVFDPDGTVPRRNMATFIMNALAHTNLRPAGLTAQRTGTTIEVSVRNAEFKPVPNSHIDAFSAATAAVDGAFKDDGTCRSSRVRLVDGGTACQIDGADPITQSDGNTTLAAITDVGDGRTVWIWTGDFGDKYDNDDTTHITVDVPKGASGPITATSAALSNDLAKNPAGADVSRARFGATITVTIQLKGAEGVNAPAPRGNPVKYEVVRTHRQGALATDTFDAAPLIKSDPAETVTIGPDGSATFTITATDSDTNNRGQRTTVQAVVSGVTGNNVATAPTISDGDAATTADGTLYFVFSDEAPVVTSVAITTGGSQNAPASGSVGTAVTVSVRDQFGNPVPGAMVALFSNDPTGTGDNVGSSIPRNAAGDGPREYATLRSGSVRIGYTYTGGASQESLVAIFDGYRAAKDLNGDGDTADAGEAEVGTDGYSAAPIAADGTVTCEDAGLGVGAGADVCSSSTKVNWVRPAPSGASTAARTILSIDADDGQLIVSNHDSDTIPNAINFDSNDYYIVNSEPKSMDDFVKEVTKRLAERAKPLGTQTEGTLTLAWTGYVADDASAITQFTLVSTPRT